MYTRTDGLRGVQEAEDRRQYVARDQDEVRMMFLSMRATRDAARRGEHVAGWRLDAGRGAILRECPVLLSLCALLFLRARRARPCLVALCALSLSFFVSLARCSPSLSPHESSTTTTATAS